MLWEEKIITRLKILYQTDEKAEEAFKKLMAKLAQHNAEISGAEQEIGSAAEAGSSCRRPLTQEDTMLITYGDTLTCPEEAGLKTLTRFLEKYVRDKISHVHLLPIFPYTSDDGFSVVDYRQINSSLGTWENIRELAGHYGLMLDAVINHVSRSSRWFQSFLAGEQPYTDYFITCDPEADYHHVARPRALPLLTRVETASGEKYVWTTFSTDQIDLNFQSPDVLAEILDTLVFFAEKGASFIRLDAIGYAWKEAGTSCLNLPGVHELVKLIRDVLDRYAPQTRLITETNVPQEENLAYFGNGFDEAQLIYQFPLPPLTMYTLVTGDASIMTGWLMKQKTPSPDTAFFNFLSSHDGIGLRPTEGILTDEQRALLEQTALENGGRVSYKDNGDGTRSPYELNINYQDALAGPEESDETRIGRFLAAQTLLLSLQGMPGIYLHSLLGSRNDYRGLTQSGIPRRINRAQIDLSDLEAYLESDTNRSQIFRELIRRLDIRRKHEAFSPQAGQTVHDMGSSLLAFTRRTKKEKILVIINITGKETEAAGEEVQGTDLLSCSEYPVEGSVTLKPYQAVWLRRSET